VKSRDSQCNETLLVRAAVRPGKKLGHANWLRYFIVETTTEDE